MRYNHVLAPLTLRNVTLKNRVVRTAHGSLIGSFEPGGIGPGFIGYHEARAKGGVGLSILEICSVHPSCAAPLQVFNPGLPDGYKRLIDAIKPHGMALMQQLWHAGHSGRTLDGSPPWSASDIPSPVVGVVPTPMTKTMIDDVIAGYAKGAAIARTCGLEGVEVHAAHTYLPQQFLSPVLNRREDEYGGSLENRMRFLMEVLTAVRAELGPDLALSIRLSTDGMANAMTEEENRRVLARVEASGLIDFINFSTGSYFSMPAMIAPMSEPTGYQLPTAASMGADTRLPRLVTGRFRTLEEADQVIRLKQAELVSLVRATIADPNLVRKTLEGREDDVRPCIACNQACVGNINRGGIGGMIPMSCAVNPTTSKEATFRDDEFEPAARPQRALVVGGGPAGLEAARVLALRGHKVTLAEAQKTVGGQLNFAKRAPFRHTIGDISDWLENQVLKLGVEIQLNTFVETSTIEAAAPDIVVIATGSTPRMDGVSLLDPSIPTEGVGQGHVLSSHDFMAGPAEPITGHAIVADDVGHYEAVAVAETMLARGAASVTLVTRLNAMAPQLDFAMTAEPAKRRLYASGRFRVIPNAGLHVIGNGSVRIGTVFGTQTETLDAALVVLISFNRCNRDLFDDLSTRHPNIHLIGDALAPRYVESAIRDANFLARAL